MRMLSAILLVALTSSALATEDPDEEIARRHFAAGTEAYDAGDYKRAATEFEAARKVKGAAQLDYNIARCYDRLEDWPHAIAEYQRYLAEVPDAPDGPEIRARVDLLKSRLPVEKEATPPQTIAVVPTAQAPPPVEAPRRRWLMPTLVGGGALALAIVGTALVASVTDDYNRLYATCPRPCSDPLEGDLKARAYAGYALWATAGAVAIVDAALWVLWARSRRAEVHALVGPHGGGLVVGGAF